MHKYHNQKAKITKLASKRILHKRPLTNSRWAVKGGRFAQKFANISSRGCYPDCREPLDRST